MGSQKERIDYPSILPFLLLIPIVIASALIIPYSTVGRDLLQTILAAASIIAAVITGFLFNAHFHLRELRLEKLVRFAELQNQFKPYQEAFYRLSDQLMRKHRDIDFRLSRSVRELDRDEEFQKLDESLAIIWVHLIYDEGKQTYDTPDYEKTQSILNKDRLGEVYESALRAAALLTRYKHYQHILRPLKLKDTQNFDEIVIADSSFGMEYRKVDYKEPYRRFPNFVVLAE